MKFDIIIIIGSGPGGYVHESVTDAYNRAIHK